MSLLKKCDHQLQNQPSGLRSPDSLLPEQTLILGTSARLSHWAASLCSAGTFTTEPLGWVPPAQRLPNPLPTKC